MSNTTATLVDTAQAGWTLALKLHEMTLTTLLEEARGANTDTLRWAVAVETSNNTWEVRAKRADMIEFGRSRNQLIMDLFNAWRS